MSYTYLYITKTLVTLSSFQITNNNHLETFDIIILSLYLENIWVTRNTPDDPIHVYISLIPGILSSFHIITDMQKKSPYTWTNISVSRNTPYSSVQLWDTTIFWSYLVQKRFTFPEDEWVQNTDKQKHTRMHALFHSIWIMQTLPWDLQFGDKPHYQYLLMGWARCTLGTKWKH